MEAIFGFVGSILSGPVGEYAIVAKIFIVIGMCRVVFKPLMSVVLSIVQVTPSQSDDAFLAKLMEHKAYKIFAYFLDWGASIKLPKKEEK